MKKETNPDIKHFIDYAYRTHLDNTGKKLYITGRSGKTAERMLQTFELVELQELWDRFLECDDEFVLTAGLSIPVFESVIPKLLTGGRKKKSAIDMIMEAEHDTGRGKEDNVIPFKRIS